MLRVVGLNADGSAVVSTRGFRRIVDDRGGVVVELVAANNAQSCVDIYNSVFPNGERRAEAITYREAYRRQHGDAASVGNPQRRTA